MNTNEFYALQKKALKADVKSIKDLLIFYNSHSTLKISLVTLRKKLYEIEEQQILGRFCKHKGFVAQRFERQSYPK